MKKTTRAMLAVALTLGLTLPLAACSSSGNGGKTTCGQYSSMNDKNQKNAVKTMLEEHGESTSNGQITLARASVRMYCSTVGSDSSTIDGVY